MKKVNFLLDSTCNSLTTPKALDSPSTHNSSNVLEEKVLDSFFLSRKPSILENIEEVTSYKGSRKNSCSAYRKNKSTK